MKRLWIILAFLVNATAAYASTGCIMIGHGLTRISVQGKEQLPPLRLADCEGARVLVGAASVCFLNESNERTCRTLVAGNSFNARDLAARQDAGTGAFRATLVSLLRGDPQTKIGQTRKGERLQSFPYESVLLPGGDLVIRLQTPKERRIKSFQIVTANRKQSPLNVTPQGEAVQVPQGWLNRGDIYAWEARSDDAAFGGSFRLASTEQAAQMRLAADSLEKNLVLDEVNRQVLLAEIYFENGFAFDAAGLISTIATVTFK